MKKLQKALSIFALTVFVVILGAAPGYEAFSSKTKSHIDTLIVNRPEITEIISIESTGTPADCSGEKYFSFALETKSEKINFNYDFTTGNPMVNAYDAKPTETVLDIDKKFVVETDRGFFEFSACKNGFASDNNKFAFLP